MKKIFALILCLTLTLCCLPTAFAADTSAKLYAFYDDNMLFAQNKEAVFAGTATAGAAITAELFDRNENLCASGEGVAASDGTFTVSFMSPEGGYDEYTVLLKADSAVFATLEGVVFGELWLAGGQSNMMYPLSQAKHARQQFENGEKLNKWIRALHVPAYPNNTDYTGFSYALPQNDIVGAQWFTGEDNSMYSLSAVGYTFAEKLQAELDIPVGFLNISLGGTMLATWISRAAIDGDSAVKTALTESGRYIPLEKWATDANDFYSDMAANYNHKIAPLTHFRPTGMIWYQGESDLMNGTSTENYAKYFDLMQRSYSELFHADSLMPFIFTQIAPFPYSEDGLKILDWNDGYRKIRLEKPDSRAMVTIYDLSLSFLPEAGSIHPDTKLEIGQRMAFAAENLVYGGNDSCTAATVKSTEIRDGAVFVTFENVGDSLAFNGKVPYGFAVCGDNGVFVEADAEIVSADTVRVYSSTVPSPRAASYAYCMTNVRGNLYTSENGTLTLPVAPFVTDSSLLRHNWADKMWADCDSDKAWHITGIDLFNKFHSTWRADGAELSFADGHMNIKSNENRFFVIPVTNFKDGDVKTFLDTDRNYGDFSKMSFYVRNSGTEEVTIKNIRFYVDSVFWFSPVADGTMNVETAIPADGEWHLVTVDLGRLCFFGNEGLPFSPNSTLDAVAEIRFEFTAADGADLSLDSVRFTPAFEDVGVRFEADFASCDTLGEKIAALFTKAIGAVVGVFR